MDIEFEYSSNGTITGANFYPHYNPSDAAAYLFTALFGITTVAHFICIFTYRGKWFLPMILGGIMEAFGYYGRSRSHNDTHYFGAWIQQLFLIMVAPPFISATVYTTLSRLIDSLQARDNALTSPRITTVLFVLADIIAVISQLAGIGLQASTSLDVKETGVKITLAGLYFQLVLYLLFLLNIIVFHRRNSANPSLVTLRRQASHWRRYIVVLYVASVAILVRNIARAAEYTEGNSSAFNQSEAYLYVLDGLLMWLAMTVLLVYHPARLRKQIRRSNGIEKSGDGGLEASQTVQGKQ